MNYILWRASRAVVYILHPVLAFISITFIRPLTEHRTYTVRRGLAKGMRVQGGLDFLPASLSPEERFLSGLDLRGKTIFDVGAHWGLFTLFFARACGPAGRVVAFEPHPDNAAHLARNVALNQLENVIVVKTAISDTRGEAALVMPANESSTAALSSTMDGGRAVSKRDEMHTVPTDSIDRLIADASIPTPDVVKIDVEGAELAVLRGMEQTLRTAHPSLVIEIHDREGIDSAGAANAIIELLHRRDYTIQVIESGDATAALSPHAILKRHIYCRHASHRNV